MPDLAPEGSEKASKKVHSVAKLDWGWNASLSESDFQCPCLIGYSSTKLVYDTHVLKIFKYNPGSEKARLLVHWARSTVSLSFCHQILSPRITHILNDIGFRPVCLLEMEWNRVLDMYIPIKPRSMNADTYTWFFLASMRKLLYFVDTIGS